MLFRRYYSLSVKETAALPLWERQLLFEGAKAMAGMSGDSEAHDPGDVRSVILTTADGERVGV